MTDIAHGADFGTIRAETSAETIEERLPRLLQEDDPVDAALSGKENYYPRNFGARNLQRYLEYNCPRETQSLSLLLLSEVFGQFKEDFKHEPDPKTMSRLVNAAIGLAHDLSQAVDQMDLTASFCGRLEELYGRAWEGYRLLAESDQHLIVNGRLAVLAVGRSRVPGGDLLVQGLVNYRNYYLDNRDVPDRLPEGDVLPAVFGHLSGSAHQCLWPEGQVRSEYLASANAGCHWTNEEEQFKLIRILHALGEAIERLGALPELPAAPSEPPAKRRKTRSSTAVWPYAHSFQLLGSDTTVEFEYLRRLDGERLLFEASSVDKVIPEKLLIKFTQSYGREVHEELARSKYAPKLFGFNELPGGWKMVVMEYLDTSIWKHGFKLTTADLEIAQRGLQTVRTKILLLLKDKSYVHGDIRFSNLMFRVDDAGDTYSSPAVQLVDFEFAGKEGVDRYPWNLNPDSRPECQQPFALLAVAHDEASLRRVESQLRGAQQRG